MWILYVIISVIIILALLATFRGKAGSKSTSTKSTSPPQPKPGSTEPEKLLSPMGKDDRSPVSDHFGKSSGGAKSATSSEVSPDPQKKTWSLNESDKELERAKPFTPGGSRSLKK